jgi:hypothetical protein
LLYPALSRLIGSAFHRAEGIFTGRFRKMQERCAWNSSIHERRRGRQETKRVASSMRGRTVLFSYPILPDDKPPNDPSAAEEEESKDRCHHRDALAEIVPVKLEPVDDTIHSPRQHDKSEGMDKNGNRNEQRA